MGLTCRFTKQLSVMGSESYVYCLVVVATLRFPRGTKQKLKETRPCGACRVLPLERVTDLNPALDMSDEMDESHGICRLTLPLSTTLAGLLRLPVVISKIDGISCRLVSGRHASGWLRPRPPIPVQPSGRHDPIREVIRPTYASWRLLRFAVQWALQGDSKQFK